MQRTENLRITAVWIATSVLTVASATVAWLTRSDHDSRSVIVSLVVLAIAGIKARLILRQFMEVRTAPAWLRLIADVWLIGLFAIIVALYLQ